MAEKLEQARAAPRIVAREMHAYALGLADETGALLEKVRQKGREDRAQGQAPAGRAAGAPGSLYPRLVIRGGKSQGAGKSAGRKSK